MLHAMTVTQCWLAGGGDAGGDRREHDVDVDGLDDVRVHAGAEGALHVLTLHPLLNPAAYVTAGVSAGALSVARSPAHDDGAWISLCGPGAERPLQAVAAAVDPRLRIEVTGTDSDWSARIVETDTVAKEFPEVSVAKISGGASFVFEPRRSLPLTVRDAGHPGGRATATPTQRRR